MIGLGLVKGLHLTRKERIITKRTALRVSIQTQSQFQKAFEMEICEVDKPILSPEPFFCSVYGCLEVLGKLQLQVLLGVALLISGLEPLEE